MSEWAAKRFWKTATPVQRDGAWTIELDGRLVRTPGKAQLSVPTEAMATALAAEWEAQDETIDPNSMPVTRAANSAIDKVSLQFAEVAEIVAAYGDSDLICYRSDAPAELVRRQNEAWNPLVDWAEKNFGTRPLLAAGVMHVPQPPELLHAMQDAVSACGLFELTALHDLVALSGSLVMGISLLKGEEDPATIWRASRIDEDYQIEQWGEDEEAAEVAERKRQDFLNAYRFLELSRQT